jgi:hypothetical protein
MPPLIGMNHTCGIQLGTRGLVLSQDCLEQQRGGASLGVCIGAVGTGCRLCVGTIAGTDPRILFRVWCECIQGVLLSSLFVVGLGAVIIARALVMQVRSLGTGGVGVFTLCSTLCSALCSTLCSTLCFTFCSRGDVRGNRCRSPGSKSHSWTGLIRV